MSIFSILLNPKARMNHQLETWAEGESLHNDVDHQCCPDFSCCHPHLASNIRTRQLFVESLAIKDVGLLEEIASFYYGLYYIDQGKPFTMNDSPDLLAMH